MQPCLSRFSHCQSARLPAHQEPFAATLTLPSTSNHTLRLLCSLQFRLPSEKLVESIWKVMKSPVGGEDNLCLCCISHLRLGSFPPSQGWKTRPFPGFESSGATRGSAPKVLTAQRPRWPIQPGFGRTDVLVLSCTLQKQRGQRKLGWKQGRGRTHSQKSPSPPLRFNADWISLDVFSNKKCRCRPNSPGPEMTANLHFLIKLAASFYERGLGYANQMVVYERLGEFGNKFHKC